MPSRANQATGARENWQWKTTGHGEERGPVRLTQPLFRQSAVGLESIFLAVLSWRYRVLWELLNVTRYSDLKKKKKKELEESEEIVGINKANFKAKCGPKAHQVSNFHSDEATLKSFGECRLLVSFWAGIWDWVSSPANPLCLC